MEDKQEIVESNEEQKDYSKRDKIKYLTIYSSIFVVLPTILATIFTLIFHNPYLPESIFAIFGSLSILIALFRSTNRDTKNYRKNHTIIEDKETPEYRLYSFHQRISYIVGAIVLLLAVGSFYLMYLLGQFNV